MARMAFKVNDNGKKIVQCLNYFTRDLGFLTMEGNSANGTWYYIDFDSMSYKITKYDCLSYPPSDAIYKEQLPLFMDLPLDIQVEVVKRSKSKSPLPFLQDIAVSTSGGGFTWDDTPEGHEFWSSILQDGDIDLFYKQFKSKENESRLQEQESSLRGGSGEIKCGLCCRKHKPRVEVKPVSYKKVIGRG